MREKHLELYEDAADEHRWRLVAGNGEIVADSGEGYTRASDAKEAAVREFPDVPFIEEGGDA